jgi:hypothetical protein
MEKEQQRTKRSLKKKQKPLSNNQKEKKTVENGKRTHTS